MPIDSVAGALIGTAVGDAWGLPFEGLAARLAQYRLGTVDRYSLLGRVGYVSDDTEQSALVVQAVIRGGPDDAAIEKYFRRSLVGWFLRLPFGIGLATLRASVRMLVGIRESGVNSAGNGAAMRSPILGVLFCADAPRRRALVDRLSRLTHVDSRGVEGAQFTADVAAAACSATHSRAQMVAQALELNRSEDIKQAVRAALALGPVTPAEAAKALGNTGFVIHSVALTAWAFVFGGDDTRSVLRTVISAGGDTDTHAAIVGAWLGAQGGVDTFAPEMVSALQGGAFGREHLLALAAATKGGPAPRFSVVLSLLRNLLFYPVILAHGFSRPLLRLRAPKG